MRAQLVLGLALVAGCSTFSEGSNAPGDDAGTAESGSATESGAPDAAIADANPDDGGIPPPKPCEQMLLCDDFERVAPADSRWSDMQQVSGGVLGISSAFSKSPTRSLEVLVPKASPAGSRAILARNMPPGTRRLVARLWLRVESVPADGPIVFVDIVTERGHVILTLQGEKLILIAQNSAGNQRAEVQEVLLPIQQPHELVLDYHSALQDKATLLVDTNTQLGVVIPMLAGGGKVSSFQVGAIFTGQSVSDARFYIDDVSLDSSLF